jgi:hypothetical protein
MDRDNRSAAVRLILYDYGESPYNEFEQYWKDHTTHYLTVLGPEFNNIVTELVKFHYL